MVSKSSTGSRPDALDTSTRCTRILVRSMSEKLVAEAVAVRALDQAGRVGDDEAAVAAQGATPRFGARVVNG